MKDAVKFVLYILRSPILLPLVKMSFVKMMRLKLSRKVEFVKSAQNTLERLLIGGLVSPQSVKVMKSLIPMDFVFNAKDIKRDSMHAHVVTIGVAKPKYSKKMALAKIVKIITQK